MSAAIRLGAAAVTAALIGLGVQQAAAQDQPIHLRGEIASVATGGFAMTTDTGEAAQVTLAENAGVFTVSAADLSDIGQGRFVGITSIEVQGQRVALEVHIFDESLRGIGEGHYPWDLVEEENMMTNADVAEVMELPEGRELRVTYTEGEGEDATTGMQTILVPEEAAIVLLYPTTADMLKVGEPVFVIAQPQGDGAYVAPAVVVGQDGVTPPM